MPHVSACRASCAATPQRHHTRRPAAPPPPPHTQHTQIYTSPHSHIHCVSNSCSGLSRPLSGARAPVSRNMVGATAHPQRPTNVPRLAFPSAEAAAAGGEIDSPAFRRQINVALGRSHSQRTPRRDVVFNVKHGRMVESQKKVPLAMGSSSRMTTPSGGCDRDSQSKTFSVRR